MRSKPLIAPIPVMIVASLLARPGAIEAAPITGATVTNASASTDIQVKIANKPPTPLRAGSSLRTRERPMIVVPAGSLSWADLTATPTDMAARLKGSATRTTWSLPCSFSGSGFISWSSGGRRGCSPPGVVIQGAAAPGGAASVPLPSRNPVIAMAAVARGGSGLRMPQRPSAAIALRPEDLFSSCSATDAEGGHARTAMSLGGLERLLGGGGSSLCDQAVRDCDAASGGPPSCEVVGEVGMGQWSPDAVAYSVCDGQLSRFTSKDALLGVLPGLLGQTLPCSLVVLGRGDALLRPQGGQIAAIAFEKGRQGVVVSVIQGSLQIVSRQSTQWQPLEVGQTFNADNGEIIPTLSWLPRSELCQTSDDDGDQPTDGRTANNDPAAPLSLQELGKRWSTGCRAVREGFFQGMRPTDHHQLNL